ncbi:MAG: 1-acyl-sn-glycerol-3-phosphate acyltransferase [Propionibacteriaceae bacterium]|jgi:1-acyl-sn-glycerol-3-phosphate acyltransferase|nr:1-acyl-sn-glycerol-3-phosphate acyltransferase [Propionibacteriaceae bacterium]
MAGQDTGKYSGMPQVAARFVAQRILMKSYFASSVDAHVHGRENLTQLKAPFIAIGNHTSHLDACMIFCSLPWRLSSNLASGAAADYFFSSWYKAFATRLFFNTYPVEREGLRNRKGLSGELLSAGVPLLLFPEGTRSRTGAMGSFKPGAAALSISRNVPILPIALVGNYAAMPYGTPTPVSGRPPVHVVFGRPMKAGPAEVALQFSERLRRYIIELHDTTARAYDMPTQADYDRAVALRTAAVDGELPPY